ANNGYGWGLLRASGGFSLGGQVAGAAGLEEVQKSFNYAAMGTAGLYAGINILKGVKDWIYEDRFGTFDVATKGKAAIQPGNRVHVNGMATGFDDAVAEAGSRNFNADILAYNPSSGPIADLTESFLDKATFTSSISRQLGGQLSGLSNISLSGFSQGGMIASNTSIGLGLQGQRHVLSQLRVDSTQISQIRVWFSGAIGSGLSRVQITYGTGSMFDFSNFLGPNLNPVNFSGGTLGVAILPFGIVHHFPVSY
ncbi:MAG: hypothetical protein WCX16_04225, partial [Candidatus Omnitrophota bacterium]